MTTADTIDAPYSVPRDEAIDILNNTRMRMTGMITKYLYILNCNTQEVGAALNALGVLQLHEGDGRQSGWKFVGSAPPSGFEISGEEAFTALANAGINFPGSAHYITNHQGR